MKSSDVREKIASLHSTQMLNEAALKSVQVAYKRSKTNVEIASRVREVMQSAAQLIQTNACVSVSSVVSQCLSSVFDEPYEFVMDLVKRRGHTEVDLCFRRDGHLIDPMTAAGGGVIDVASFALRVAAIILSGGKLRRILVLDEPFKFVSSKYRGRVRSMLQLVVDKLGFQIIMVTHIDELKCGTVIDLQELL